MIERNRDKCINIMEKVAKEKKIKPIEEEEYKKMKKDLKKKKAPDQQEWRYEWIECAGKDLEESLQEMLNKILETKIQPKEWKEMRIKSIAKDSKKKMEIESRRGLFLTNIISKCMEKVLLNRRKEEIEAQITAFQSGGIKGRSISDNLFILNTVIDEYRIKKENLYILFGDLEKCFDKLCLKDCIIELVECGIPVEEAIFLYEMNTNIEAEVDTPSGKTKAIKIKEVVRQGTIYGPMLCGISTDRITKMGKAESLVIEDVELKCPIFVDDIAAMGKKKHIEDIAEKMKILETTKKFVFNITKGKSEVLVIKNNKKEEEEVVEIEVRKGKIGKTGEYKYLGDYYSKEGNNILKFRKGWQRQSIWHTKKEEWEMGKV